MTMYGCKRVPVPPTHVPYATTLRSNCYEKTHLHLHQIAWVHFIIGVSDCGSFKSVLCVMFVATLRLVLFRTLCTLAELSFLLLFRLYDAQSQLVQLNAAKRSQDHKRRLAAVKFLCCSARLIVPTARSSLRNVQRFAA